jgi:hypothetical protein
MEPGGENKVVDTHSDKDGGSKDQNNPPSNKGKMIVDATCTPADIAYPTDLTLLNEAREKTEEIIDAMHKPFVGIRKKPRTYRQKARKAYLAVAKQKKPGYKKIRKTIGQQLRYLKRNLGNIDRMAGVGLLKFLDKRLYRLLLVIKELYRQQYWMYENRTHKVSDRIVSLYQPHVRPMVRGKAKSPVEFGAKVSISLVEGFSFVEKIGWDAYNESCDLRCRSMWIKSTGLVRIGDTVRRKGFGCRGHRWAGQSMKRNCLKNKRSFSIRMRLTGLPWRASSVRANAGSAWPV